MPRLLQGWAMLSVQAAQEMPEGSLLHFDKELLIQIGIQLFNVAVLTVILVFLLYKPVKKYMADRTRRIADEMETARQEREKARELSKKYEDMLAGIEKEREAILSQAHKKAVEKSDQLLFEARKVADAMYSRALAELETERENVSDEMKRQMIEISTLIASRFVEVSIDRETQDKYIEQALADWEES